MASFGQLSHEVIRAWLFALKALLCQCPCSVGLSCISVGDVLSETFFFLISQVGEGVCTVLLSTLIPMATEMLANGDGTGFPELMVVMATLASAGQGAGHLQLHSAAVDWLGRW